MGYRDYSVAKGHIVDALGFGDFKTIGAALAAATSGQSIFIRPGTYTENPILVAGVNLVAFMLDSLTPNVTINGTCSFSGAGRVTISGIRLQTNSAALLSITGTSASIITLQNCYLNCTNNTGITYSVINTSAILTISNCMGNLGTTGIALFTNTSTGQFIFNYSTFSNTGGSSTPSTCGSGANANSGFCFFSFPFVATSSGNLFFQYCNVNTSALNTSCLTTSGSGNSVIEYSDFISGNASAFSIGSGTTVKCFGPCRIDSSNTNAITGAGTLQYSLLTFTNSSIVSNVTTQTPFNNLKPAFLATHSVAQNAVTGNGATVTVNFTTKAFDLTGNYDGTNTFTAPITGKYFFSAAVTINNGSGATAAFIALVGTSRTFVGSQVIPLASGTVDVNYSGLLDMTAGDTVIVQANMSGLAGNTANFPASVTNSYFSGFFVT